MKIRLHEVEFGSADVQQSSALFQSLLGLQSKLTQPELTVLDTGISGFDLNISSHFPAGVVAFSFLTNNLEEVEQRLKRAQISYQGPLPSHLGMRAITYIHADGYVIRINTHGEASPEWLKTHRLFTTGQ